MNHDPRKMRTFQKWYYDKEDEQRMEEYAKEIDLTRYSLCSHWLHIDTDNNVADTIFFVERDVDSTDLGIIFGSNFDIGEPQAIVFRGSRHKLEKMSESKRAFLVEGLSYQQLSACLGDSSNELDDLLTIVSKKNDGRQRVNMLLTKKNPHYCAH